MERTQMSREAFADLLDRFGPEAANWPAAAVAPAEALVAADAGARADLDAARTVARVLARAALPVPVDSAFVGRVMAQVREGRAAAKPAALRLTPRFAFAGMTGLAMCLAVGLAIGILAPAPAAADYSGELAVLVLGVDDADAAAGDATTVDIGAGDLL